jgi:hypothetical protein
MKTEDKQYTIKDFCPLCGSRFLAKSTTGLFNLIMEHNKDWCEKHFIPFSEAIKDDCFEARKPTKIWRTT